MFCNLNFLFTFKEHSYENAFSQRLYKNSLNIIQNKKRRQLIRRLLLQKKRKRKNTINYIINKMEYPKYFMKEIIRVRRIGLWGLGKDN